MKTLVISLIVVVVLSILDSCTATLPQRRD